jgi:hypothetical protein
MVGGTVGSRAARSRAVGGKQFGPSELAGLQDAEGVSEGKPKL